jgi:hypothetical protein
VDGDEVKEEEEKERQRHENTTAHLFQKLGGYLHIYCLYHRVTVSDIHFASAFDLSISRLQLFTGKPGASLEPTFMYPVRVHEMQGSDTKQNSMYVDTIRLIPFVVMTASSLGELIRRVWILQKSSDTIETDHYTIKDYHDAKHTPKTITGRNDNDNQ